MILKGIVELTVILGIYPTTVVIMKNYLVVKTPGPTVNITHGLGGEPLKSKNWLKPLTVRPHA